MDNSIAGICIAVLSLMLSYFHYNAGYEDGIEKRNFSYKFLSFYRFVVNYFITGSIAYYFISAGVFVTRTVLTLGDFLLGLVFLIGILVGYHIL
ncbi:MAG: hypothetical protein R3B69_01595 [Candidatus Paceibacterota bacterium]